MADILWSYDQVRQFADHSEAAVRDWTLGRLSKLFPDQAAETAEKMLADEDHLVVIQAIRILENTRDSQKYGPILFELLQQADGGRFATLAEALVSLGYRQAAPVILDYIQQSDRRYHWFEFYRITNALSALGGEEVRQGLWNLFDQLSPDDYRTVDLMRAIVAAALPEDISRLAEHYRAWRWNDRSRTVLALLAETANADDLFYYISDGWDNNVLIAMGDADSWLGHIPELSNSCVSALIEAFEQEHQGVFDILLAEAHRIVDARGDHIADWRTKWEVGDKPVGYRRQAPVALHLLEIFAAQSSPDAEQREQESILGLSLIFQLSTDQDDQGRLEGAADKTDMLLTILMEDRQHVWPNVVDQVVALGEEVAPRLVRLLQLTDSGWGLTRLVEAIAHLAQRYPGSCDAAVPNLIGLIHDQQPDEILEGCSDALRNIGPAAVSQIAEHLEGDDFSRQIYLAGTLSEIPTEAAAQALLAQIETIPPSEVDDMYVTDLANIGSASAIEPLYNLWQAVAAESEELGAVNRELAHTLLILCELHAVDKPELADWRQIVAADRADTYELVEQVQSVDSDETEPISPTSSSTPKQKNVSKAKKKSGRHKGGKGKQKKKKRRG